MHRKTIQIIFSVLIAIALLYACSATQKTKVSSTQKAVKQIVNVAGEWTFSMNTPAGWKDQQVVLSQEGNTAEGMLNDKLTIFTIKNDSISFDMDRETPMGLFNMFSKAAVTEKTMVGKYTIMDGPYKGIAFDWEATKSP